MVFDAVEQNYNKLLWVFPTVQGRIIDIRHCSIMSEDVLGSSPDVSII